MTHPDIQKRVIDIIGNFGTSEDSDYNDRAIQALSRLCAEKKETEIPLPVCLVGEDVNMQSMIVSEFISAGYDEVEGQPRGHRAFFGAFQFSSGSWSPPKTSVSLVVVEETTTVLDNKPGLVVTEVVYLFNFGFTGDTHDVKRENPLKSQQSGMIDWPTPVESSDSSEQTSTIGTGEEEESAEQKEFIGLFAARVSATTWDALMELWEKGDGSIEITGSSVFGQTVERLTGYHVPKFQVTELDKLEQSNPSVSPTAVIKVEYRGAVSQFNKPLKNVIRYASVTLYRERSTAGIFINDFQQE